MRHSALAIGLILFIAPPLTAQETAGPRFEIGLVGSDSPNLTGGDRVFGGWSGNLGLYADVFLTDRLVVSPSATGLIWGDGGFVSTRLRTDVRYLFRGSDRVSPYVFASGTAVIRSGRSFQPRDDHALGGGVGLRLPLTARLGVSLELRYDRWLELDSDHLNVALRVGIPLGGR